MSDLPVGTRVRLSAIGRIQFPKSQERRGTVVGEGKRTAGCVLVQWDSRKEAMNVPAVNLEAEIARILGGE